MNDVEYMFMETRYVCGLSKAHGGGGDPAPVTAFGVLQGMKACADERLGQSSLKGVTVAVQGLGSVGFPLARLLKEEGAQIVATDLDEGRRQHAAGCSGYQGGEPGRYLRCACGDLCSLCSGRCGER